MANTIPVPPEHQFPELTVLSGEGGGGRGEGGPRQQGRGQQPAGGGQQAMRQWPEGPSQPGCGFAGLLRRGCWRERRRCWVTAFWCPLRSSATHPALHPTPPHPCCSRQPAGRGHLAGVQRHLCGRHPGMRWRTCERRPSLLACCRPAALRGCCSVASASAPAPPVVRRQAVSLPAAAARPDGRRRSKSRCRLAAFGHRQGCFDSVAALASGRLPARPPALPAPHMYDQRDDTEWLRGRGCSPPSLPSLFY